MLFLPLYRRAKAFLEAAPAKDTLVIHKDDRSTDFLRGIYQGLGYEVLTGGYTQHQLKRAIEGYRRVFMLGHGSPGGLFWSNYLIDDEFGPLLAQKPNSLFIWCNADAYAKRNRLSGLVSGMFISEVGEARMFGINASQEQVDASNALFSKVTREYLDTGASPSTVRQCYTHETCAIVKFNSERLYVFEDGTPTPALHHSSAAHPSRAISYEQPDDSLSLSADFDTWYDTFEMVLSDHIPASEVRAAIRSVGLSRRELWQEFMSGMDAEGLALEVADFLKRYP